MLPKYMKGLFSPKLGPAVHNLNLLVFHTPPSHSNFHCFISPSSFCPSPQQDTKQTTGKVFSLQCCKIGWVCQKISKKKKEEKRKPVLSPSTRGLLPRPRGDRTAGLLGKGRHGQRAAVLRGCQRAHRDQHPSPLKPGCSTRCADALLYTHGHSCPHTHPEAKSYR